jgi:hypothetical protein
MSNRNTKRADENRTMRRDLTPSVSVSKQALGQVDNSQVDDSQVSTSQVGTSQVGNSKGRKPGKRKSKTTKASTVAKAIKVNAVTKELKVNPATETSTVSKIIKGEAAHLTGVNAASSGNKSVSGKAAKRKTLLGKSSQIKPAIKQLVSEHSELAMRAAKRIKASKNKRKTSHLVCHHLCMMLNSPISATSPSFRQAALSHRTVPANEPLGQRFLPI